MLSDLELTQRLGAAASGQAGKPVNLHGVLQTARRRKLSRAAAAASGLLVAVGVCATLPLNDGLRTGGGASAGQSPGAALPPLTLSVSTVDADSGYIDKCLTISFTDTGHDLRVACDPAPEAVEYPSPFAQVNNWTTIPVRAGEPASTIVVGVTTKQGHVTVTDETGRRVTGSLLPATQGYPLIPFVVDLGPGNHTPAELTYRSASGTTVVQQVPASAPSASR